MWTYRSGIIRITCAVKKNLKAGPPARAHRVLGRLSVSRMVPSRWNVFTRETDFDAGLFDRSLFQSLAFKFTTAILASDLALGIWIGLALWPHMPPGLRGVYVVAIVGLPIVWVRMVQDHRKMRQWYAAAPPEARSGYPVRMAAHLTTFAPHQFYFIVFLLLFLFAITIRWLGGHPLT
jgi:hypothetical protein